VVEPQTPDATRPWRETRDDAYQLVLARLYRAALPMLRTARAGARLAQRDGAASAAERESALIDELNILVRMVACHHDGADLPGLLSALRDAVGVHHDLAGRAHLAAVTREQTNVVLSGLTGVLESWRARLVDEAGRIDLLDASADVFESLADVFAAVGRPDAALAAAERGRARTFADLLVARRDPAGEEPTDGELTGGADVLGVHDLRAAVAGDPCASHDHGRRSVEGPRERRGRRGRRAGAARRAVRGADQAAAGRAAAAGRLAAGRGSARRPVRDSVRRPVRRSARGVPP
jgi:hypothetical protein